MTRAEEMSLKRRRRQSIEPHPAVEGPRRLAAVADHEGKVVLQFGANTG